MRLNGEATVSDVLLLLNEAARLDPDNFATQEGRARLALLAGDHDTMSVAIDAAERVMRTDEQRIIVIRWRASLAGFRRQYVDEHRLATSAVEMGRRAVAANVSDPVITNQLMEALNLLADVNLRHGEPVLSAANAAEALAVSRTLASVYPQELAYKISVVSALLRVGAARASRGRVRAHARREAGVLRAAT